MSLPGFKVLGFCVSIYVLLLFLAVCFDIATAWVLLCVPHSTIISSFVNSFNSIFILQLLLGTNAILSQTVLKRLLINSLLIFCFVFYRLLPRLISVFFSVVILSHIFDRVHISLRYCHACPIFQLQFKIICRIWMQIKFFEKFHKHLMLSRLAASTRADTCRLSQPAVFSIIICFI